MACKYCFRHTAATVLEPGLRRDKIGRDGQAMNMTRIPPATDTDGPCSAPDAGAPRSPLPWIFAWGIYSLLALGYLGYNSAFFGTLCIAR